MGKMWFFAWSKRKNRLLALGRRASKAASLLGARNGAVRLLSYACRLLVPHEWRRASPSSGKWFPHVHMWTNSDSSNNTEYQLSTVSLYHTINGKNMVYRNA